MLVQNDMVDTTIGNDPTNAGFKGVPQKAIGASYTLALSDSGKHIYPSAAALTVTIPSNASVPFPIGTAVTFANTSGGVLSVAISTDTLILAGIGSTGVRTLANNGMATALKVNATKWLISGAGLS